MRRQRAEGGPQWGAGQHLAGGSAEGLSAFEGGWPARSHRLRRTFPGTWRAGEGGGYAPARAGRGMCHGPGSGAQVLGSAGLGRETGWGAAHADAAPANGTSTAGSLAQRCLPWLNKFITNIVKLLFMAQPQFFHQAISLFICQSARYPLPLFLLLCPHFPGPSIGPATPAAALQASLPGPRVLLSLLQKGPCSCGPPGPCLRTCPDCYPSWGSLQASPSLSPCPHHSPSARRGPPHGGLRPTCSLHRTHP